MRDGLAELPAVRLHGTYQPADLDAILDAADVGLVPSTWEEVLGHVGLECLAKGLPVIANARGGVLDYALPDTTGWVNRSCGGAELAEIMAEVIDRPEEVVRLNGEILERRDELVKPLERHLAELDGLYAEVIAARSNGGS